MTQCEKSELVDRRMYVFNNVFNALSRNIWTICILIFSLNDHYVCGQKGIIIRTTAQYRLTHYRYDSIRYLMVMTYK